MMKSTKLKLFSNCIPVKGAKRSIICDLQRNDYDFIPNTLCQILKLHDGKELSFIDSLFVKRKDKENFHKYLDFLLEKEYIFLTEEPELFPLMSMEFNTPFHVNNSIIDYTGLYPHTELKKTIQELDILGCQAVHLRFYEEVKNNIIEEILKYFNLTGIRSIHLLIKYNSEINNKYLQTWSEKFKRISEIVLHGFTGEKSDYNSSIPLFFQKDVLDDEHSCGHVSPLYFSCNIPMFTESKSYNSCLNKKISIDKRGEIKNCPSMKKSFGNMKTHTLKSVLFESGFQDLWNLNKDQIAICKDCEFRYICTDCRAYTQNNGRYSKPLKCNYDPYKAQWEN